MRLARHDDQAFGCGGPCVGLGEGAEQVEGLEVGDPLRDRGGRSPGRRGRASWPSRRAAGASGRASPTRSTDRSSKPIRVATRSGDRLAGHAVLGQLALADVVQQRRDHQDVGTADVADQRRRLDAGLDEVPVDGEPVDDRGVRQQPDALPLGQHPVERRRSPRACPRPHAARVRRRAAGRTAGAPPRARAPARSSTLADEPRGARRRQLDVAFGGVGGGSEQQQRVTGRVGVGGEHHLPRRQARRLGPASPAAAGARPTRTPAGRARHRYAARSAATGGRSGGRARAGVVGRPPRRPGRAPGPARPRHRARPGRSRGRRRRAGRRGRRATPSRDRSRSTCGTSTSQVATSALSTVASRSPPSASFRSGTETWASSPISSCRESTIRRSSGSRSRAVRRHWVSTWLRSRSVRFESPARCRMSSSPRATRRSFSAASSTPRRYAPSGRAWSRRPTAGTRPARRPGPARRRRPRPAHVEVGVRRQLGPPVAADRHQRHAGRGQAGRGEGRRARGVGGLRPGLASLRGHAQVIAGSWLGGG